MRGYWRALHPLGPVGAQAIGQGCNLLSQVALLAMLGQERFSGIGLGIMAANSVMFLGEVGLGTYFLRESARSSSWMTLWQRMAGTRLLALAACAVIAWAALGWGAVHADSARAVLLSAGVGLIASAFNPIPLLFGTDQVRWASAGVLCRFGVQSVGYMTVVWLGLPSLEIAIGAVFSLSLIVLALLGQVAGLPSAALVPRWPGRLPWAAVRLWAVSLAGTAHDRFLPFMISSARPDLLAVSMILIQGLQTLAGVGSQIDRLMIPMIARTGQVGLAWHRLHAPLVVFGLSTVLIICGTTLAIMPAQIVSAVLLSLEWLGALAGGLAFSIAFAQGREKKAAAFLLLMTPLSLGGQYWAGEHGFLEGALAMRAMITWGSMWLAVRACR